MKPIRPPTDNFKPIARLPLHAELAWSDTCICAGITVRTYAPVLAMCRQLLAAGLDPDQAMEVWRAGTLALRVRSIGEAAELEIGDDPPRFRRRAKPVAATHIAQNRLPLAEAARPAKIAGANRSRGRPPGRRAKEVATTDARDVLHRGRRMKSRCNAFSRS
jgi:hypothetical protein